MPHIGDVAIYDAPEQTNLGYLTGSQPIWSDDDDATSATGFATLEPLFAVATVMYAQVLGSGALGSQLEGTIRATWGIANTGFQQTTGFVLLHAEEPIAFTDYLAGISIEGSGLGLTEDLPFLFDSTSVNVGHTWPEVQAAYETSTLWISVLPGYPDAYGFNNGLTVYELDLVGAAITPARLVYPRTDSIGPANGRLYPPPNTQQTGSRFGSSSPL